MSFLFALIGFCVYFAPSLWAYHGKHPKLLPIFALNFLLGWTLIGWVIALIWALNVPVTPSEGAKP